MCPRFSMISFCKQTLWWTGILSDGLDEYCARSRSYGCTLVLETSQTLKLKFGKVWKCSLMVLALLLSARPRLWYLGIKSLQRRTQIIDFFVVKCFHCDWHGFGQLPRREKNHMEDWSVYLPNLLPSPLENDNSQLRLLFSFFPVPEDFSLRTASV